MSSKVTKLPLLKPPIVFDNNKTKEKDPIPKSETSNIALGKHASTNQHPKPQERVFYSDLVNYSSSENNFILTSSPNLSQLIRKKVLPDIKSNEAIYEKDSAKVDIKEPEARTNKKDLNWVPSVLEPKVLIAFEPRPGVTPRKLEIERRKRQFNSVSMEDLLKEQGITAREYRLINLDAPDSDASFLEGSFLPFHSFDNNDFEERSILEWLSISSNEKIDNKGIVTARVPIPAKALISSDPDLQWEDSLVTAYDFEKESWKVNPRSNSANEIWLHRLDVMFKSEDPFKFAKRVAAAHKLRLEVEDRLRYQFYIDNMPIGGAFELPDVTMKRIISLLSSGILFKGANGNKSKALSNAWIQAAIRDIKCDYSHAMNGILMSYELEKHGDEFEFKNLVVPKPEKPIVSSWSGFEYHPEYDFDEQSRRFRFATFLTNAEVFKTWCKVKNECEKLATMNIFNVNMTKTVKIDEFEQIQTTAINNTKNFLKDNWLPGIKSIIKNGLREVGKGWFNLQEKSMEVYAISKLKKFMTSVRFVMEDSLRFMMIYSLQEFVKMIILSSPFKISVDGTNSVNAIESHDNGLIIRKPLFMLDLVFRDGKLTYSIDLGVYKQTMHALVDKALAGIEGLPQLEPLIMDQLFWSSKGNLETMRENENFVSNIKSSIAKLITDALVPLDEYLHQYDKHLKLMGLEPVKYMQEYEFQNHTNEEMEQDILRHIHEAETLNREIPIYIHIGIFWVNCDSIKASVRKDLSKVVLDIFARKTGKTASSISQVFSVVQQKLKEKPLKIEELVELRQYMQSVPEIMSIQKLRIVEIISDYDKLERFRYELANEDFKAKWLAYSWPAKIEELMKTVNEQLESDQSNFLKNFMSDQELFKERLNHVSNVIADFSKYYDLEKINEIVAEVQKVVLELKECASTSQLINSRERLFAMEPTRYDEVANLNKEFEPYRQFWLTAADWLKWRQQWLYGSFLSLQAEEVDKNLNNAWRVVFKATKNFRQTPTVYAVANKVKEEMDEFKPKLPLIQALRNPGMRDRHWDRLSTELGIALHPDQSCTLTELIDMNLMSKIEAITKICDVAGKEYAIESSLDKMEKEWANQMLDIISYRETGTYIIKVNDEALRLLDDHIVMTQSMSFSPFRKPFQERITLWESKLRTVQEVLEEWMNCQRSWMYLEPIFSSEDIAKQLPTESKRFVAMDRMWRKILTQAKTKPGLIEFCSDNKLLEQFHECNKLLEHVSKGLSAYLESKRLAFPRFFFLSDDELLQILSQSKNPTAVQPHLRKCFENVNRLEFSKDNLITAMFSADGEKINLSNPFYPTGNVEDWLRVVEDSMKKSVRQVIFEALKDYPVKRRNDWVLSWPGQAVLTAGQTHWTTEVTEAIQKGPEVVKNYYQKLIQQLEGLVLIVRGDLKPVTRLVISDLIVIDVHARDIVKRLADNRIQSINDFEWMSQLRYYWEDDDIRVKIVNANFKYGYEYLGNTGRLVITPLTDRCYLTLTGAIHLTMGGSPSGPAGTGKTETVKDLAKSLAKQCVVFNCSDQLDYLAMAKFFKGLASAGAWICFDEFNRIDIEVLSVIAQQISTIQRAVSAKAQKFTFEGVELTLDATCAIMITMNPGYAGRTELPDNLKALFRPVAMMIPDYAMIAEISLFSFGFSKARTLAQKMVATFKLSSEQLSSQDHYDFGMRAVKTVISSAGNLKRNNPDQPEDIILLRALIDTNVPKFLAEDVPLFNGIISDLFPGVQIPSIDYGLLLESLHATCHELGLQPVESFIKKCIQMYETTVVRHGMMLVGPTGGGKTSCYHVLSKAITRIKGKPAPGEGLFEAVRTFVLNPKSITMGQLYGEFDAQTHEWTDGILSSIVREGAEDSSLDKKWYVFDGPVDAVWIESMNTVLDDNKKLCLSSGEIIKLSSCQRMIFEVENLAYASPATVSRCGMVYIEPSALGIKPLLQSWLDEKKKELNQTLGEQLIPILQNLFDSTIQQSLEFVRKYCVEKVQTMNSNLVQSLLRLIDCFIRDAVNSSKPQGSGGEETEVDRSSTLPGVIESFFYFSVIWSIGATFDDEGRTKFDKFLRELMLTNGAKCTPPPEGQMYDYKIDTTDNVKWQHFLNDVPTYKIDPKLSYSEIIVPTLDSVRNTYLLHLLFYNNFHVLCLGNTGTAKTVTVGEKLIKGMGENYTPIFLNFSARTSANQTQDFLDSKMDKRRKGVYGPPLGKRFIVFIDDLNMPAVEIYGAQPPIELIRQWMDHGGWYDRKNIGKFMEIVDISVVAAMCPPGGGRNKITPRMTRHFNLIHFNEMGNESLHRIFNTIVKAYIDRGAESIRNTTDSLVQGSINVYETIRAELLPTPAKSHYLFNLRDLSKVFQGILSADIKMLQTHEDVHRLWVHESVRVFQDRLVDETDRKWFTNLLKKTHAEIMTTGDWSKVVVSEPILYGDFLIPNSDQKSYSEFKDLKKVVKVVEDYLDDYNNASTQPMKLVMFLDAIEHVSRICRVIRQPLGNVLLLGVGGSGRQSLSRLAAHIEEFDCFQIEVSKSYGLNEWKEDLKKILLSAGLDFKPTVFLFCDTQIVTESFLEDINNILNSGDVPNIYNNEELDRIMTGMRPVAVEAGLVPTRETLFALYLSRVKQNLHVILCMSPIGEVFRNRLRMFPSLVNCCTIDYFNEWPDEALRSVAASSIMEMNDLGPEKIVDGTIRICVMMHQTVRDKCKEYRTNIGRHNYVTPKSYLELLALYKTLFEKKRGELIALRKRTSTGLDKLLSTTKEVEILQEELGSMQPMLIQTSKDIEIAIKQIAEDKSKAEEMKEKVTKEENEASKKAEETRAIADDAKRDLDEALPALDAALVSLKNLTKQDITEVRSMQRPPDGVKLVIEAVCIMKGLKPKRVEADKMGKKVDDYWEVGRGLLADPAKFMDSLLNFDKDNIPEAVVQKIKPYIDSPDFQVDVIARVSKAATSMCQWVRAMEKYFHVSKAVAPKRARLQEAQESLEITIKTLNELKRRMKETEMSIREMEKKYSESMAKKEELARKVDECNLKLSRAEKLLSGLGDEKQRWAATVVQLEKKLTFVVGDILLAAGAVAYLGAFTTEYRVLLIKEWTLALQQCQIPYSETTSLIEALGDQVKIRQWEINGLPKESLSRDNAIIVFNSRRWPLLIDPQGQANKWIKNMEKESGLEIVKLTDKDFLRTLENAIRFGRPCLLENIQESLDPALEPILQKQVFKQGGSWVIKLGDSIIPYHDDFRFYMTTKMPNPHYSPEISAKVTLLNFTLSASGLEDQLLALVVANERPDLEEAKNLLMVSNAKMKKELKEIEDKILYLLSSVQGSPVDDERLIETLAASKVTSSEIQIKVHTAEQTEKDIDSTRSQYIPVAVRTRILFFCITELAGIDPMYQYSLNWFMVLFTNAIANSEKSDVLSERLKNLNEFFTFSLYCNVCRSLFEKHKLLFCFLLTVRILMNDGKIDLDEYRFLLAGGTAATKKLNNPSPDWLTSRSWDEIQQLATLPRFNGMDVTFAEYEKEFKCIFESLNPHREPLPGHWKDYLDRFQGLCVLRTLRADRITSAIQDFVSFNLGERFIEPQTADLAAVYKESTAWTPLVFVLSPGADPAATLIKFADEMRFGKKLNAISLGQGQGPRAELLLREGMERGLWILLQNCHLSPSWMPVLDRIVENITPDKVHRDFRLWLTSMPTAKFPVSILQNGVKMTVEPPKGLKANLMRTYATFNDDYLSGCDKAVPFKKLLFSLSLFHAVIQERRKFGPLGWNIPYEFTDGDHRICARQLKMFLEEYNEIPFKVLKYTVGEINYGGRVTDDWDRRLIMTILEDYYTPLALGESYQFSASEIYVSPPADNYQSYKNYIKALPLEDSTAIFGMMENANITFAQKETFDLFDSLVLLMPKTSAGGSGKSRDEVLLEQCLTFQKSIPLPFNFDEVCRRYPIQYKESMSTVLVQEVVRYNRLLSLIHDSLKEVIKALRGLVVMSESLEKMCNSVYINQVPNLWASKAYPSLKGLVSWVDDLCKRIEFLQNWIDKGIPPVFWISGFFFPQAFLTGTLQNYARKHVISIDLLEFEFHVQSNIEITTRPDDGCYISGLFLEGARYNEETKSLDESRPKELYTNMPIIWLKPVANKVPEKSVYKCPVYKTLTRAGTLSTTGHSTNYVLTIELPSKTVESHWIKRGVALICSLNY